MLTRTTYSYIPTHLPRSQMPPKAAPSNLLQVILEEFQSLLPAFLSHGNRDRAWAMVADRVNERLVNPVTEWCIRKRISRARQDSRKSSETMRGVDEGLEGIRAYVAERLRQPAMESGEGEASTRGEGEWDGSVSANRAALSHLETSPHHPPTPPPPPPPVLHRRRGIIRRQCPQPPFFRLPLRFPFIPAITLPSRSRDACPCKAGHVARAGAGGPHR
jgi:hypothetical protein